MSEGAAVASTLAFRTLRDGRLGAVALPLLLGMGAPCIFGCGYEGASGITQTPAQQNSLFAHFS
jgi:hypothetical protein